MCRYFCWHNDSSKVHKSKLSPFIILTEFSALCSFHVIIYNKIKAITQVTKVLRPVVLRGGGMWKENKEEISTYLSFCILLAYQAKSPI
jgi:hypothetical protein